MKTSNTTRFLLKIDELNMKIFRAPLMLILSLVSQSACSIPREDVLECGLSNGDKFVMRAEYEWNPLAKVLPGDVATRLNQESFHAEFKPAGRNIFIKIPGSYGHKYLTTPGNAEELCAIFGSINNVPYVGASALMPPGEAGFIEIKFDEKLRLSMVKKENSEKNQADLDRFNLRTYPSFGAIKLVQKKLVREQTLFQKGHVSIAAVFQSESLDMGKTWSDPIITTEAEIFELGKPILEQSFTARPIKINGKKVDASFPPPPSKKQPVSQ